MTNKQVPTLYMESYIRYSCNVQAILCISLQATVKPITKCFNPANLVNLPKSYLVQPDFIFSLCYSYDQPFAALTTVPANPSLSFQTIIVHRIRLQIIKPLYALIHTDKLNTDKYNVFQLFMHIYSIHFLNLHCLLLFFKCADFMKIKCS